MEEFNPMQFANPNGEEGERLTTHMNSHHKDLTDWGLNNLFISNTDVCLDIGCGGGYTASELCKNAKKVMAVDISPVCVNATINNNIDYINSGKLQVLEANAKKLPFEKETINIVTAVETLYFWQDTLVCFQEINRVLKKGGTFLIIMETYATEDRREYNLDLKSRFDYFNIFTPEQLEIYLKDCGFSDVMVVIHPTNYWIAVYATK